MLINHFYNNLKKKKVLLMGDLLLDQFIYGDSFRISPEAPVPVVQFDNSVFNIGAAGNVAVNLSNLLVNFNLISVLGVDEFSVKILKILRTLKIKNKILINKNFQGILKQRIISRNQQIVRVDYEKKNLNKNKIFNKIIKNVIYKKIKEADMLLISDYGKGAFSKELIKFAIETANQLQIPSIVDPRKKNNDFSFYKNCTYITPNLEEMRNIFMNLPNSDNHIVSACKKICLDYKIKNIIVTRGEMGVTLYNQSFVQHVRAIKRFVFDVSGAGDTFISVFSTCVLAGLAISKSLKMANLCSGYIVTLRGTKPITSSVFKEFYKKL